VGETGKSIKAVELAASQKDVGEQSRLHSLTLKKANKKRKLVIAGFASYSWKWGSTDCNPCVRPSRADLSYSCFMIRLPILKDELAFLEKLLPDLETRPDLGHLAIEIKKRIDKIRQEIRALQENR
jgi:hypothetical protein